MISLDQREEFINKIMIQLEMCNYGFQVDDKGMFDGGYSLPEAKKMLAIKELIIRMNIWKMTGKKDKGSIPYPEARRRIDYNLDDADYFKCYVHMLKSKNRSAH